MKIRKSVGAIITNEKGEILLVNKVRIMDGKFPVKSKQGEWVFPQGGIKYGETNEEALKREIFEEINITEYKVLKSLPSIEFEFNEETKNILKYDGQFVYYYDIKYLGNYTEIKPDYFEIDDIRFVKIEDAINLLTHNTSKEYLKKITNYRSNESKKIVDYFLTQELSYDLFKKLLDFIKLKLNKNQLTFFEKTSIDDFYLKNNNIEFVKISSDKTDPTTFFNSLIALIILNSDGDFFKSYNWVNDVLNINSQLVGQIIHIKKISLYFSFYLNRQNENTYFGINRKITFDIIKNIDFKQLDIRNFLKSICIKDDNKGKLSGKVKSENNIIYHKREGNEFSINITNKCPNACTFCIRDFSEGWNEKNLYLEEDPSLLEIKSEVKRELDLWNENLYLIKFCGYGEPLLRPDIIIEISKFIKSIRPEIIIQVNTSGWPYYKHKKNLFEEFKNSGISSFSVSLNATDRYTYEKIVRPGVFEKEENAYDDTIKFIKDSVSNGFYTKVTIVKLANFDQEKINRIESFVNSLGAKFIARSFIGDFNKIRTNKKFVEIETKVLNINRNLLIEKLKKLEVKFVFSGLTAITNFELPKSSLELDRIKQTIQSNPIELRNYYELLKIISESIKNQTELKQNNGYIRVKEEDNKVYIVYKEPYLYTSELKYENEIFYEVENFESAREVLKLIGLKESLRLERFREKFHFNGVNYYIDKWPLLDYYLEIEGTDEMAIYNGFNQLNLDNQMRGIHTATLFKGKNIDEIKFEEVEKQQITAVLQNGGFSGK